MSTSDHSYEIIRQLLHDAGPGLILPCLMELDLWLVKGERLQIDRAFMELLWCRKQRWYSMMPNTYVWWHGEGGVQAKITDFMIEKMVSKKLMCFPWGAVHILHPQIWGSETPPTLQLVKLSQSKCCIELILGTIVTAPGGVRKGNFQN